MSPFEKREQLIKLRLESLYRERKVLSPREKWPTVKGVRAYKVQQAKLAAQAFTVSSATLVPATALPSQAPGEAAVSQVVTTIESTSSSAQANGQSSSTSVAVPTLRPSPSFPFPVTVCKQLAKFPQFGLLPVELRLQIWDIAFSSPRFIEVQFCSDFYQPTFINLPYHNPLSLVCRESAEVVSKRQSNMSGEKEVKLTTTPVSVHRHPHLTFSQRQQAIQRGETSEAWPLPTLRYVPSRDTIFLRSLGHFDSDPLSCFSHAGRRLIGMKGLQHLALPFDATTLAQAENWVPKLHLIHSLKILTLMVGSKEKSWVGSGGLELRPLHYWFADGRKKWIDLSGKRDALVSTAQLAKWLLDLDDKTLNLDGSFVPNRSGRYSSIISVRVVAWKKN